MPSVIFDFDGVLIDTNELHYLSWAAVARKLGIGFDREINDRMRGLPRHLSVRVMLGDRAEAMGEEAVRAVMDEKNHLFLEMTSRLSHADMAPGAAALLEDVAAAAGLPMALASCSRNAVRLARQLGLARFFAFMIDGNDVSAGKPDPEVFLRAASGLGAAPAACVVIEDGASGVEAARRGGMKAVGVGPGSRFEGADLVVASLEALSAARLSDLFAGQ